MKKLWDWHVEKLNNPAYFVLSGFWVAIPVICLVILAVLLTK